MFDDPKTLILALIMLLLIMAPLLYFFRAVLRFSQSLEVVEEEGETEAGVPHAPAMDYAMSAVVEAPFDTVLQQTKQALSEEGFGVVAEIDVRDTLDVSGISFRPYTILTAWDGPTMGQTLGVELGAGLLMPARLIVFEVAGGTVVAAMDPRLLLNLAANPNLLPLAVEARFQLQRVIDRLEVGPV